MTERPTPNHLNCINGVIIIIIKRSLNEKKEKRRNSAVTSTRLPNKTTESHGNSSWPP